MIIGIGEIMKRKATLMQGKNMENNLVSKECCWFGIGKNG